VAIFSPDKIKEISPKHSIDLLSCFISRKNGTHNKIQLNQEQQRKFLSISKKINSLEQESFGSQALIEAYFIELLVYINRWFRENFSTEKNDDSYGFNANVKAIIDYINDNFTKNISLELLEEKFHLNKHYMCQLFKKTTGTTIHRYIVSRRLSRAKILLHQGHNVTATSDMCGFQNYTNFIRAFKQHFGVSPKQFAAGKQA
jgi:AraC-like DNA-binding protein